MKKKKFVYTVRRANLKERVHFLLTGKIPSYWKRILYDFSITMTQALKDPDFPLYKDNPELRKEFLNFFSTFRPTYKYMEKWIWRKWNLFPEDKKRNKSSDPDYFPDLSIEVTTFDGKDRTEEQRFNDIVEFYKENFGHKTKVLEKEI